MKQTAAAIAEQYEPDDAAESLRNEGIPPAQLRLPADTAPGNVHDLGHSMALGVGRSSPTRRFAGYWLADRLLTGPKAELKGALIDQLARQGWHVREADAALVTADPAHGLPATASFLRASRLHPLIDAEARPQFQIGKREQAVFGSMRAVEGRVRDLADLGNDAIGVSLMNTAFGPTVRLTDTEAPKGEQEGTRALFVGAYAVLRNPPGHRQVDYDDTSEAAEAVQTASLLTQILDRVQESFSGAPPAADSVSRQLPRSFKEVWAATA